MKKTIGKILCAALILVAAFSCFGCASGVRDPKDAIKEEYGNTEFTISFNTNGLDEPISDISYTANKMPVLPTPTRVGYVFSGWYLDSALSVPYVDDILYLYMKDVTLYAKWIKEEMAGSGIYDLDVSVRVLDDTVTKGLLTDAYGGYKDISEKIDYDSVQIESADGHKYLRIVYDSGIVEDMMSADELAAFRVLDSDRNDGAAFIDKSKNISNYADTKRTIFVNIDRWNMETPLYLDVKATNWDDDVDASVRAQTTASYTIEIKVERFIGFSKPFADYTQPLDDGWYLVKSYYRSENNTVNMGSGFNPVYSYLQAKSGRYTLVKEFTPYLGMLGASNKLLDPVTANYFYRLTSFAPVQLYYDMDASRFGDTVSSDYYPETYDGTYFGEFAAEFHADTGKYYAIYDYGTDLTREKMIMGGITGYMEAASSMGAANQILSLDYEHIVKLSAEEVEKDYTPLGTDDAYSFEETMQYYPGNKDDLAERNLTYSAIKEYGAGTHLYNFFFSTSSLSTPYPQRKVYSSRISVSPTKSTNAATVASSRYSIAHFTVNAEVYGYEETDGESLYGDSLTLQSLGSNAMRENVKIVTGKGVKAGEKVSLPEIYAEKVNSKADFSAVTYTAYKVKDGKIDYSSAVSLPQSFNYGAQYSNVAVVFTAAENGRTVKTPVYLTDYEEPVISRITDYSDDELYAVGDVVRIPNISYGFMGKTDDFFDDYFDGGNGEGIHIIRTTKFSVDGGVYNPTFFQCVIDPTYTMNITAQEIVLLYELQNEYRERSYYELSYFSQKARRYVVSDGEGNVIDTEDITYKDGQREPYDGDIPSYETDRTLFLNEINKTYTLSADGTVLDLPLISYTLYTDKVSVTEAPADNVSAILSDITAAADDGTYCYVKLVYSDGKNVFSRRLLYRVTIGGRYSETLLDNEAYFINRKYSAPVHDVYGVGGERLGSIAGVQLYAYKGDELLNNIVSRNYGVCTQTGYNIALEFYVAGKFRLDVSYRLDNLADDTQTITFRQDIEVLSDKSDVSVTYVTDDEHPFSDGSTEKRVYYNLAESVYTMTAGDNFYGTDDVLFGWVTKRQQSVASAITPGGELADYMSYNTTNVYLYAVWDQGVRITTSVNGTEKTYDTLYFRSTVTSNETGDRRGSYKIDLGAFVSVPPQDGSADGYEFIGWTGGFIGTAVRTGVVYISAATLTESDLIITPVYKRYLTVTYSYNSEYSASASYVFKSDKVLDGSKIADLRSKMRIRGKSGYTFVGWATITDGTANIVDLYEAMNAEWADENYMIKLVAVFTDSEGKQVW